MTSCFGIKAWFSVLVLGWETDHLTMYISVAKVVSRTLPLGVRMERLGGKFCPLDGRVTDHAHVLKNCSFSAFGFDTVRKAVGLVDREGTKVEPSRLLLDRPEISLRTTHRLVLWAALKAPWKIRCAAKYQHQKAALEDFVALWAGILERWTGERNMWCSRADLHHLIAQLHGWCESRSMFRRAPTAPTTAVKKSQKVDALHLKEAKWGAQKKKLLQELEGLQREGRVVAYTHGSAKRICGWMQAGYGVWFGPGHKANHTAHVPAHERQSISRRGLRGVLHAMLARDLGERLVVVLDSEYVCKGMQHARMLYC